MLSVFTCSVPESAVTPTQTQEEKQDELTGAGLMFLPAVRAANEVVLYRGSGPAGSPYRGRTGSPAPRSRWGAMGEGVIGGEGVVVA